jgi:hypothetical protein
MSRMRMRTLNGVEVSYDREPDRCPSCHLGIQAIRVDAALLIGEPKRASADAKVQVVFRCPSRKCQELFIGYYVEGYERQFNAGDGQFYLKSSGPYKPESPEVFEGIAKLSPRFSEIYGQALAAEHYGLEEVAGGGLRKALEFLIKDYCVSEHPDREEAIKKMFLGDCITQYVDHEKIKTVARRAAWLGNDEIHYLRKWVDKDLQNLKELLALTMAWVEMHLRTNELEKSMRPRS